MYPGYKAPSEIELTMFPELAFRRTGRTWKQLEATPDGSWYVVISTAVIKSMKKMLVDQGRDRDAVNFISCMQIDNVRGREPAPVVFDHAVAEFQPRGWAHALDTAGHLVMRQSRLSAG